MSMSYCNVFITTSALSTEFTRVIYTCRLQEWIPASKFPLLNPCIHKWDFTFAVYNWKTYKCKSFIKSLTPGQTFKPTTPNISFVPWLPKRSVTMLDSIAQRFQYCLGHSHGTAGPNIVGSCCIRLHTSANTDATTANNVGPTMLGVVASVCT